MTLARIAIRISSLTCGQYSHNSLPCQEMLQKFQKVASNFRDERFFARLRRLLQSLGQEFPGTALTHQLFQQAVEKGLGEQGTQGLINLFAMS